MSSKVGTWNYRDHFKWVLPMATGDKYLSQDSLYRAVGDVLTKTFGFSVAKDPVHVHDLQATWMHLLGFDHEQLTYRFQGRDYRLTDVHGHVVKDLLA